MNNKRTIHKLSSVIDILSNDPKGLNGKSSIRVRYDYDAMSGSQKFTILDNDIVKKSADKIILWLKKNITSEDIVSLETNELDLDLFKCQKKAA